MNRIMTAFAAVFAFAASTAIAQPQPAPGASAPAAKTSPASAPGAAPLVQLNTLGKPRGVIGIGAPPSSKDFPKVKEEALKNIESTLARLTKDRKCVTAAATPQALLECRRASAAAHREMIDAQRARMGLAQLANGQAAGLDKPSKPAPGDVSKAAAQQ